MSAALHLGMTGVDVDRLQQALVEAGQPATGEGSTFGPATLGAVKTFQAKRGLEPDGIVGEKTWAALSGEGEPAGDLVGVPAPNIAVMSSLMARALLIADGELRKGVAEIRKDGRGRNRGPDVDGYLVGRRSDGRDLLCYATYVDDPKQVPECGWCKPFKHKPQPECFGSPWCARFALWCVQGAADALGIPDPTVGAGDLAGASKWLRWARRTGRLVGEGPLAGEKPRAGDVALISVEGHGHVILAANVVAGDVLTREGNASDAVRFRRRPTSSITAFVRL